MKLIVFISFKDVWYLEVFFFGGEVFFVYSGGWRAKVRWAGVN